MPRVLFLMLTARPSTVQIVTSISYMFLVVKGCVWESVPELQSITCQKAAVCDGVVCHRTPHLYHSQAA